DAILDVSIRREGDLVWINASLSDTRSGFVLWSRRYEHAMLELFATQAAIAAEAVEAMLGAMPGQSEAPRLRLEPPRSVAAPEAHARARAACARAAENGSTPPEVPLALGNLHRVDGEYDKALAEFRRAAADPGHAAVAHVGMAKVEAARGDPAGARRHFDQAL